ncbi:uncharacterized protein J3D65DRAFT_600068 [Phyllosticta citribraziliensis]|uniref:Proteophosphoglycan ppg4 n=1 Tax=Phyllosticta citribraziliensis TaxID=989973 RepID=A0ABR1M409_9PEZI
MSVTIPSASSSSSLSTEPFPSLDDVASLSKPKHLVPSLATLPSEGKATANQELEDVDCHGNSPDPSDSGNTATHSSMVNATIIPPSSWYPPTPLPSSISSSSTSSAVVARPPRLRKDFRFDLARVALSLASATAEASTSSSASTSTLSAAYASLVGKSKNENGSASGRRGMEGMRRWSGGLGLSLGLGLGLRGQRTLGGNEEEDDDQETTPDPPPKSELRKLGHEGPVPGALETEGRRGSRGKGREEGRDGTGDTGRTTNTGSAPRTVNGSGRIAPTAVAGPSKPPYGPGPHHQSSMQSCRVGGGCGLKGYSTPSSTTANANAIDLARDLEVPVDLLQLIEHDILELLDAQPDADAADQEGQDVGIRDGDVRRLASSSLDLAGVMDAVEELESCEASVIAGEGDEEEEGDEDEDEDEAAEEEDTEDVDERAGDPTWGADMTDESHQCWRDLAYAAAAAGVVMVSHQQVRQRQTSRSRSTSASPTAPSAGGVSSTAATGSSASTALSPSSIRSLSLVLEEVEDKDAEAPSPLFAASPSSSPPGHSPSPPLLPPAPSPTPNTTPCSPLSPAPSVAVGNNRSPMASPSASPRSISLPSPLLSSLYGTTRVRRVASQRSLRKTALLQAVLAEMAGPLAEEAGEERMARARLLRRTLAARAAANAEADAVAGSDDDGSGERRARARGSWEGLGSVGGWVYL